MSEREFSAEDLSMVGGNGGQENGGEGIGGAPPAADGGKPATESGKPATEAAKTATEESKTAETKAKDGKDLKTIATGADAETEDAAKEKAAAEAKKPYWPDDWREKMAEQHAAGDKKAYQRELKRLQRFTDPTAVYGMGRELESKFTSGGLVKIPGKDAKPEDVAEFHKALGVPEKPEGYFETVKLENGAVIGEADKPLVDGFAAAVHKTGATPAVVNAALNWYYAQQEEAAAKMDEADDEFRRESERSLKDEWGASYRRNINAAGLVFATAPGGNDASNPNSLKARLLGGRTADGRIIGNDPEINRWLASLGQEINPVEAVVEVGHGGSMSIEQELAQIAELRKTDRRKYWSEPVQKREQELIAAREKSRARA